MTQLAAIVSLPPVSNFDQTTKSRLVILNTQSNAKLPHGPDVIHLAKGPGQTHVRGCWQSGGCSSENPGRFPLLSEREQCRIQRWWSMMSL